ncbi:MAG: NAD(P)H-hydrate dehydratase [Acidobacteria bacterium]|nr:NAD(P)H-hydrate dehydratase [Acidobacteriota bacterium]
MKIVAAQEMRQIDGFTSERFHVPSLTLMENAGSAVAEFIVSTYPNATTIGVICGKGNNGGDGLVAARQLAASGRKVRVLMLAPGSEFQGDARLNLEKLPVKPLAAASGADLETHESGEVFESDVLIDAILGSGFRPPVAGHYAEAIRRINSVRAPVVAVDIPSGADADVRGTQTGTVARANAIVTFTAPRPAHVFGDLTCGPIVIAPIGSPDEAIQSSLQLNLITPADVAPLFAPRPRDANKGQFGHVLVVGGSVGKTGAAAMAGFSALRAGAGLVTIATARSALPTVAGFYPELMTEPLGETEAGTIAASAIEEFRRAAEKKTVLAIGPGISRHPQTASFVHTIVGNSELPIVLDADGLNAFEGESEKLDGQGRTLVVTPHPGEMSRLNRLSTREIQRNRVEVARSFAAEHHLIVVLKGDRTIVASPDGEAWINTTGNPGMATGGTGDILTGMVAGILAQNPGREFASVLGAVHLHGLAGDVARERLGERAMVATDLVQTLSEAIRRLQEQAREKSVKIAGVGPGQI